MNSNHTGIAVVLLASLATGVVFAGDGVNADRLVFGQVAVLTGPAQDLGQGMRAGILAAFASANRGGGISGRKLDLISRDGASGATYLVSAENEISNRNLVTELAALLGKGQEALEQVPDRPGHDRRYALDPSKIREELGWQPQFPFNQALQRTVLWYRENPNWWSRFISPTGS